VFKILFGGDSTIKRIIAYLKTHAKGFARKRYFFYFKSYFLYLGVPAFANAHANARAVGLQQVVVLFFAFFVRSPGVFANRLSPTKK
jgi:hypothetical protein